MLSMVASSYVDFQGGVLAFVDRRRHLRGLVEDNLSSALISSLEIRPGTLLDRNALRACQLLQAHGIDITGLEQKDEYSVYDARWLTAQVADGLWQAGFKDVVPTDWSVYTRATVQKSSIELKYLLVKAAWLMGMGVDMHLPNYRASSPAVFHFSHALGRSSSSWIRWYEPENSAILRTIFLDDFRDDCSCPCSTTGCSATTKLLDGMFHGNSKNHIGLCDSVVTPPMADCGSCSKELRLDNGRRATILLTPALGKSFSDTLFSSSLILRIRAISTVMVAKSA
ncbi:hypothetical protein BJX64DRAFT_68348 [Aspergillus heterothallicus]